MVLFQTVLVGFALVLSGFFLGKYYWQSKLLNFLLEKRFIKINPISREFISWTKWNKQKKFDN